MPVRDRDLVRVNRPMTLSSDELTNLIVQLGDRELRRSFGVAQWRLRGLKPATDYVTQGVPATFGTLAEAASRRLETAIGYRLAAFAGDPSRGYGVVLNPPKTEQVAFSADDKIIVLSEN
jgi:hypothetical protein